MKLLFFEFGKVLIAMALCTLFFTLIPLSVLALLLPFDILIWLYIRRKVSVAAWIGILCTMYIAAVSFSVIWIINGHSGLEFLLDVDWIRHKF